MALQPITFKVNPINAEEEAASGVQPLEPIKALEPIQSADTKEVQEIDEQVAVEQESTEVQALTDSDFTDSADVLSSEDFDGTRESSVQINEKTRQVADGITAGSSSNYAQTYNELQQNPTRPREDVIDEVNTQNEDTRKRSLTDATLNEMAEVEPSQANSVRSRFQELHARQDSQIESFLSKNASEPVFIETSEQSNRRLGIAINPTDVEDTAKQDQKVANTLTLTRNSKGSVESIRNLLAKTAPDSKVKKVSNELPSYLTNETPKTSYSYLTGTTTEKPEVTYTNVLDGRLTTSETESAVDAMSDEDRITLGSHLLELSKDSGIILGGDNLEVLQKLEENLFNPRANKHYVKRALDVLPVSNNSMSDTTLSINEAVTRQIASELNPVGKFGMHSITVGGYKVDVTDAIQDGIISLENSVISLVNKMDNYGIFVDENGEWTTKRPESLAVYDTPEFQISQDIKPDNVAEELLSEITQIGIPTLLTAPLAGPAYAIAGGSRLATLGVAVTHEAAVEFVAKKGNEENIFNFLTEFPMFEDSWAEAFANDKDDEDTVRGRFNNGVGAAMAVTGISAVGATAVGGVKAVGNTKAGEFMKDWFFEVLKIEKAKKKVWNDIESNPDVQSAKQAQESNLARENTVNGTQGETSGDLLDTGVNPIKQIQISKITEMDADFARSAYGTSQGNAVFRNTLQNPRSVDGSVASKPLVDAASFNTLGNNATGNKYIDKANEYVNRQITLRGIDYYEKTPVMKGVRDDIIQFDKQVVNATDITTNPSQGYMETTPTGVRAGQVYTKGDLSGYDFPVAGLLNDIKTRTAGILPTSSKTYQVSVSNGKRFVPMKADEFNNARKMDAKTFAENYKGKQVSVMMHVNHNVTGADVGSYIDVDVAVDAGLAGADKAKASGRSTFKMTKNILDNLDESQTSILAQNQRKALGSEKTKGERYLGGWSESDVKYSLNDNVIGLQNFVSGLDIPYFGRPDSYYNPSSYLDPRIPDAIVTSNDNLRHLNSLTDEIVADQSKRIKSLSRAQKELYTSVIEEQADLQVHLSKGALMERNLDKDAIDAVYNFRKINDFAHNMMEEGMKTDLRQKGFGIIEKLDSKGEAVTSYVAKPTTLDNVTDEDLIYFPDADYDLTKVSDEYLERVYVSKYQVKSASGNWNPDDWDVMQLQQPILKKNTDSAIQTEQMLAAPKDGDIPLASPDIETIDVKYVLVRKPDRITANSSYFRGIAEDEKLLTKIDGHIYQSNAGKYFTVVDGKSRFGQNINKYIDNGDARVTMQQNLVAQTKKFKAMYGDNIAVKVIQEKGNREHYDKALQVLSNTGMLNQVHRGSTLETAMPSSSGKKSSNRMLDPLQSVQYTLNNFARKREVEPAMANIREQFIGRYGHIVKGSDNGSILFPVDESQFLNRKALEGQDLRDLNDAIATWRYINKHEAFHNNNGLDVGLKMIHGRLDEVADAAARKVKGSPEESKVAKAVNDFNSERVGGKIGVRDAGQVKHLAAMTTIVANPKHLLLNVVGSGGAAAQIRPKALVNGEVFSDPFHYLYFKRTGDAFKDIDKERYEMFTKLEQTGIMTDQFKAAFGSPDMTPNQVADAIKGIDDDTLLEVLLGKRVGGGVHTAGSKAVGALETAHSATESVNQLTAGMALMRNAKEAKLKDGSFAKLTPEVMADIHAKTRAATGGQSKGGQSAFSDTILGHFVPFLSWMWSMVGLGVGNRTLRTPTILGTGEELMLVPKGSKQRLWTAAIVLGGTQGLTEDLLASETFNWMPQPVKDLINYGLLDMAANFVMSMLDDDYTEKDLTELWGYHPLGGIATVMSYFDGYEELGLLEVPAKAAGQTFQGKVIKTGATLSEDIPDYLSYKSDDIQGFFEYRDPATPTEFLASMKDYVFTQHSDIPLGTPTMGTLIRESGSLLPLTKNALSATDSYVEGKEYLGKRGEITDENVSELDASLHGLGFKNRAVGDKYAIIGEKIYQSQEYKDFIKARKNTFLRRVNNRVTGDMSNDDLLAKADWYANDIAINEHGFDENRVRKDLTKAISYSLTNEPNSIKIETTTPASMHKQLNMMDLTPEVKKSMQNQINQIKLEREGE